ncbi:MAG TPA: hypothetical protein VGN51_11415 [Acidimicrobiia bacterium]
MHQQVRRRAKRCCDEQANRGSSNGLRRYRPEDKSGRKKRHSIRRSVERDLWPCALTQLRPVQSAEASDDDRSEEEPEVAEDHQRRDEDHDIATDAQASARGDIEVRGGQCEETEHGESHGDIRGEDVLREQSRDDDERDSKTAQQKYGQLNRLLYVALCIHGLRSGWRRQSPDELNASVLLPTGSATGEQHCDQC